MTDQITRKIGIAADKWGIGKDTIRRQADEHDSIAKRLRSMPDCDMEKLQADIQLAEMGETRQLNE